jgi:hypothetical protein
MENVWTYLLAIIAVIGIMLLWVWVQSQWRETFSENISDPDVLAERRSCGNCGCTKVCNKKQSNQASIHQKTI